MCCSVKTEAKYNWNLAEVSKAMLLTLLLPQCYPGVDREQFLYFSLQGAEKSLFKICLSYPPV